MARSSLSLLLRLAGKLYSHNNPHTLTLLTMRSRTPNLRQTHSIFIILEGSNLDAVWTRLCIRIVLNSITCEFKTHEIFLWMSVLYL